MTSTNKLFRQHYVEMKGQLTPEQQEWYIEKFKELGIKEIGFWAGFSKVGKTSQAAMLREY